MTVATGDRLYGFGVTKDRGPDIEVIDVDPASGDVILRDGGGEWKEAKSTIETRLSSGVWSKA